MKLITREFVNTSIFDKRWNELNLSDNDLRGLQNYIMQNLSAGDIIEGTGGACKIRFALPNRGKSGGIRVIYVDMIKSNQVHLLTCYPKSKQDNLTDKEKLAIKEVIKRIIKREREGL